METTDAMQSMAASTALPAASDYGNKADYYFSNARREIEPLLPPSSARALEVGCGRGGTMQWLRHTGRVRDAWGIELFEPAAKIARAHFADVQVGDAEALVETAWPGQQFDLVLCLDVLEHLVDPWRCADRLAQRLAPGGKLIASLPNVRCLHTLMPLLLRGEWRYTEDGLLDRTHLRFFTRGSAIEMLCGQRLQFERCIELIRPGTRLHTLDRLTFGLLRDLTTWQYLICVSKGT
ncbi:MAG TPA: class I SAM-dependent methyltransferase [Burkholderiaceae bacterium]|nr:class I SAM-dependent methyltransferase [Burkholderiaceae bacterium]